MKEIRCDPLRDIGQKAVVVLQWKQNENNQNIEEPVIRSRCSRPSEFFFPVDKAKRHDCARDGCTNVSTHNDRYRALNGNRIRSDKGNHHGGGRRTALDHRSNDQSDK